MIIKREDYENHIAYLRAVCRIAADKLRDGGTFPIKGETWALLDYAAGPAQPAKLRHNRIALDEHDLRDLAEGGTSTDPTLARHDIGEIGE